MPFAEQEVAQHIAQAHSLLERWTSSLWGHPIQLVDPAPAQHVDQGTEPLPTVPEQSGEDTPGSQAEPVLFDGARFAELDRGRTAHGAEDLGSRQRAQSHRRRRLQAALASSSSSERDSPS